MPRLYCRSTPHGGFALVTALLFSSVLLIVTVYYASRVATEYRLMAKIYNSNAALDLAEAALERAVWEVRYNNNTFTGWTTATDASGNLVHTISVDGFQTADGTAIGDYTVSVSVSTDGMSAVAVATGYVPNRTSPDGKRTIKITYSRSNFSKAVLALNSITMSGQARTDSYDSSLGPYATQSHTQEGDIATNGPINLSGQAYVNGDANPGPSYPFYSVPPVSGSYGTLQAPFTVDPIPATALEEAMLDNNNVNIIHDPHDEPLSGYDFSASSATPITLPAGTYYFTSFTISGQAVVNTSGAVVIYVDGGNILISGQGLVNNDQPRNLLIYATGTSINVSGQAALSGAIYAPNASVTLTGQENFYGAIVCGQNSDSGQASIHYDKDLVDVMPVFANSRVTTWQELKQ